MIDTDSRGDLRVITIDNPARRNALDTDDLSALETAVDTASEPVVYLRGAGSAFCAGADLDVVANLSEPATFARHGQRVATAIENASAVVVAGIDGPARGGGVELALACDIRIASPAATFAEPGVRFGLFGAWGGTVRLRRVLREGDALDFALSGRVIDADEALRIGLVSRVVDDPFAVAAEIAENKADALAVLKRRLRDRRPQRDREHAESLAFDTLVREHAAEIAADRAGGPQ
ncbi:enoyl-CoA hydratase/isomerase family protein [Haloferacaceae archaeon DSL9]